MNFYIRDANIEQMTNQKGSAIIIVLIGVLVLIAVSGIFYSISSKRSPQLSQQSNTQTSPSPSAVIKSECSSEEQKLILIDNKPVTYKTFTITKSPWEKEEVYLNFDSPEESTQTFPRNMVMILGQDPHVNEAMTVRLSDIGEQSAVLCISETKISFKSIVTDKNIWEYLPKPKQFNWIKETVQNLKTWKTYTDPRGTYSFKYPLDLYDHGKNGGVPNGLTISESKDSSLTPAQTFVKENCSDELNQLRELKTCYYTNFSYSINERPSNLKGIESFIVNDLPGAGSPGLSIYFRNRKGKVILISSDGVDDTVMSKIFSTLLVH